MNVINRLCLFLLATVIISLSPLYTVAQETETVEETGSDTEAVRTPIVDATVAPGDNFILLSVLKDDLTQFKVTGSNTTKDILNFASEKMIKGDFFTYKQLTLLFPEDMAALLDRFEMTAKSGYFNKTDVVGKNYVAGTVFFPASITPKADGSTTANAALNWYFASTPESVRTPFDVQWRFSKVQFEVQNVGKLNNMYMVFDGMRAPLANDSAYHWIEFPLNPETVYTSMKLMNSVGQRPFGLRNVRLFPADGFKYPEGFKYKNRYENDASFVYFPPVPVGGFFDPTMLLARLLDRNTGKYVETLEYDTKEEAFRCMCPPTGLYTLVYTFNIPTDIWPEHQPVLDAITDGIDFEVVHKIANTELKINGVSIIDNYAHVPLVHPEDETRTWENARVENLPEGAELWYKLEYDPERDWSLKEPKPFAAKAPRRVELEHPDDWYVEDPLTEGFTKYDDDAGLYLPATNVIHMFVDQNGTRGNVYSAHYENKNFAVGIEISADEPPTRTEFWCLPDGRIVNNPHAIAPGTILMHCTIDSTGTHVIKTIAK